MQDNLKILVSRTDNIGDVILTLPMLGLIKARYPDCTLFFLGNNYTKSVALRCSHIDHFIAVEDLTLQNLKDFDLDVFVHVFPKKYLANLARQADIPIRIGTSHRLYHWLTCNRRIAFTRINSVEHEAILNLNLLLPLKIKNCYELQQLKKYNGWMSKLNKSNRFDNKKFNILFHMKSNGNAVEWSLNNYLRLAKSLPADKYSIFLTGTENEKNQIEEECPEIFELNHVNNYMAKFSLDEFIDFVAEADGLVGCSTGALHIASANGINTIGMYPRKRPMHSGRWSPIGSNSVTLNGDVQMVGNKMELDLNHLEVLRVIEEWSN